MSPENLSTLILLGSFLAMILLAGFQIVVQWAQAVYSLKINGKMAIEGNASFMWKVLKLPMEFFSQRMTGDILQRQGTNASIAGTLVNTVAPLALNTVMMLFYLVVMLRYSAVMTLVGVASLALNLAVARYLSNKRINLMRVEMRDAGKLASATLAGISMTETIKSSGAEGGFFRKWSGYQASVNTQQVKFATLNARIGLIPQFISTASNYLVLFLGVSLAMQGSFTVGMIVTFQGLLSSFMGPAMTLVEAGQTIQEMRTEMERVEDVMENPDDPALQFGADCASEDYAKLSGDVELKHVSFGYSRLGNPTVSDFSMHLKQGQRIAIVGASGCGKSTVSKLITGLYQPWAGEILFDGKPISQIPRNVFTGSVAMVDQDIVLFEDTIANNIRMWDDTIEDFEGSGELALFGEEWAKWRGMMVEGYTLYIQGKCAPRFQNSTFLTIQISNIQFLSSAKADNIEKFTISFNSDAIDDAMVTDLTTLLSEHPGNIQLYFQIKSQESTTPLVLHSRNQTIDVNRELLSYLDANPAMEYRIN